MLGRMIRDDGAREGIASGEVWASGRRALLLRGMDVRYPPEEQ